MDRKGRRIYRSPVTEEEIHWSAHHLKERRPIWNSGASDIKLLRKSKEIGSVTMKENVIKGGSKGGWSNLMIEVIIASWILPIAHNEVLEMKYHAYLLTLTYAHALTNYFYKYCPEKMLISSPSRGKTFNSFNSSYVGMLEYSWSCKNSKLGSVRSVPWSLANSMLGE